MVRIFFTPAHVQKHTSVALWLHSGRQPQGRCCLHVIGGPSCSVLLDRGLLTHQVELAGVVWYGAASCFWLRRWAVWLACVGFVVRLVAAASSWGVHIVDVLRPYARSLSSNHFAKFARLNPEICDHFHISLSSLPRLWLRLTAWPLRSGGA